MLAGDGLSVVKLHVVLSEISRLSGIEFEVDPAGSSILARNMYKLVLDGLVEVTESRAKLTDKGRAEARRVLEKVKSRSHVCVRPNIVVESRLLLDEVRRALQMYSKMSDLDAFIRRLELILRDLYYFDTNTLELSLAVIRSLRVSNK